MISHSYIFDLFYSFDKEINMIVCVDMRCTCLFHIYIIFYHYPNKLVKLYPNNNFLYF